MDRSGQLTLPEGVRAALPVAVQEELAKREIGTLGDCRRWIDELIAHKCRHLLEEQSTVAVTEMTGEDVLADLSVEDRSDVETKDLMGQFITCDDDYCDCRSGRPSDFHGPYLRRHSLDGSGHRMTEYLPESEQR